MADIPFEVDLDEEHPPESSLLSGPGEKIWSVSALTRKIRQSVESALPFVAVEGEVSNFKAAASGHLYFNLKDGSAQIRCVMFRAAGVRLKFQMEDGLQVVSRGRITVYEQRGEVQLQVAALEPQGVGALQLAFEQLKKKLADEGLFDSARKRPLPFLPRGIGMVTSPTGAAIRDMLTVLDRRFPSIPVLIHPATVQGDLAAGEIARGIHTLNRLAETHGLDVLIVGRGGGSIEDLWPFNEEVVARAIAGSRLPVISAVGHEVDFTIADFVADARAPTPSAAAEIVAPHRQELLAAVSGWRERLLAGIQNRLEIRWEGWRTLRARLGTPQSQILQAAQRVDEWTHRGGKALHFLFSRAAGKLAQGQAGLRGSRPDRMTPLYRAEVRGLASRLAPALERLVAHRREKLTEKMELLDSLSPLTTLRRGYGAVQKADGRLVRGVAQVTLGEQLGIRLADGRVSARVESVDPDLPGPKPPT